MRFDLHVHTTASDGTLTPSQLLGEAASRDLAAVAITDHDTVTGVLDAQSSLAEKASTVALIPGVELSAAHDDRDVHILGYFIDPHDRLLQAYLEDLRSKRRSRAIRIVERLRHAGYDITIESVTDLSQGGAVGRSHIARALVAEGFAIDVSDAFERLLGRGRPFYLPKNVSTPAEVMSAIRRGGGLPTLAHPGPTTIDDIIAELVPQGLWGLEAYHPDHSPEQTARYIDLAGRLGLQITGGTDYHGPQAPGPALGELDMPPEILTKLLEAAGKRSALS